MSISVIVTVKNEGDSIRGLLDSLVVQTLPPEEVVVCDGGSTDDTIAILESYRDRLPLKLLVVPGANISEGRNQAIAAATGPIIAATDAGVRLAPAWLEEITHPLRQGKAAVVSGWFEPDYQTGFERVMGATVLPSLPEIDPQTFLPSSRSIAFLKQAWAEVGGYPEWLDYCEDLIFDMALRERQGSFAFAPDAVAYFRPRGSLRAFFRQYYRYARGDGKAGLWPRRHAIRYATYLFALPLLIWLLARRQWLGGVGLLAGGAAYCSRPVLRLAQAAGGWQRLLARPREALPALALIPVIRVVGDVAKMLGYPVGVLWRLGQR